MAGFLIYQHLGIGDFLICNALVRYICSFPAQFTIVCKPSSFETIQFMYRDIKNLTVHSLLSGDVGIPENSKEIYDFAALNQMGIIKIGHELLHPLIGFDRSFYEQFGYDFENRWNQFKVDRNYELERQFYNKFDIRENADFIFVHEDERYRIKCPIHTENNRLRIIRADLSLTNNIFDYLTIIEKAKEIHCIESAFLFLIDSFQFEGELFNHRYARKYPINNTPTLKQNWKILT